MYPMPADCVEGLVQHGSGFVTLWIVGLLIWILPAVVLGCVLAWVRLKNRPGATLAEGQSQAPADGGGQAPAMSVPAE